MKLSSSKVSSTKWWTEFDVVACWPWPLSVVLCACTALDPRAHKSMGAQLRLGACHPGTACRQPPFQE